MEDAYVDKRVKAQNTTTVKIHSDTLAFHVLIATLSKQTRANMHVSKYITGPLRHARI